MKHFSDPDEHCAIPAQPCPSKYFLTMTVVGMVSSRQHHLESPCFKSQNELFACVVGTKISQNITSAHRRKETYVDSSKPAKAAAPLARKRGCKRPDPSLCIAEVPTVDAVLVLNCMPTHILCASAAVCLGD
eukprot:3635788-Amphidinium_carterae.2